MERLPEPRHYLLSFLVPCSPRGCEVAVRESDLTNKKNSSLLTVKPKGFKDDIFV